MAPTDVIMVCMKSRRYLLCADRDRADDGGDKRMFLDKLMKHDASWNMAAATTTIRHKLTLTAIVDRCPFFGKKIKGCFVSPKKRRALFWRAKL